MKKAMKMFAALFSAAIVFAFTGCTKDLEKDIVGSWKTVGGTVTQTIDGESHTTPVTLGEGDSTIMTFNEDHTYVNVTVYGGQSRTGTGTYSIKDDKLTLTDSKGDVTVCTIDIDGDEMTLTYVESREEGPVTMVVVLKRI